MRFKIGDITLKVATCEWSVDSKINVKTIPRKEGAYISYLGIYNPRFSLTATISRDQLAYLQGLLETNKFVEFIDAFGNIEYVTLEDVEFREINILDYIEARIVAKVVDLSVYSDILKLIKKGVLITREVLATRTVSSPSASTTYYLPESGYIDASEWDGVIFLVNANQACTVQVEGSTDGSTFKAIEGVNIPSSEFNTGNVWNWIYTTELPPYVRLAVTTGGTPPSSIEMKATGVRT